MSAPMTEAAFRRAFVEAAAGGIADYGPNGLAADAAVAAALAAGVVFAPEAPALPERLEVSRGFAMWDGWAVLEAVARGSSKFDHVAVLTEAVRRYNAYPALREAAEKAIELIENQIQTQRAYAALENLKAVLAEGAQP